MHTHAFAKLQLNIKYAFYIQATQYYIDYAPQLTIATLRLKEQLGSGQFGTVYRGLWRKESEGGGEVDGDVEVMEVAVKSLGKDMSENERVMFLKEAAIMGQFNHQYIVKILGIIYDEPVSSQLLNFSTIINFYL